jgi:hypothetical protein
VQLSLADGRGYFSGCFMSVDSDQISDCDISITLSPIMWKHAVKVGGRRGYFVATATAKMKEKMIGD